MLSHIVITSETSRLFIRHKYGAEPRVLFVWLLLSLSPWTAQANERTPAEDRIIKLTLPLDAGQVTGIIIQYSELTFTLQTEQGQQHRVLWNAIPGQNVDRYWRYLEEPQGNAKALFELGDILIRHPQGEQLAQQAFDEALKLDPTLSEAIEQSLAGNAPNGTPRYVGTADPAMWGELSEQVMQQGNQTLRDFAQRTQQQLNIKLSLYESERFMLLTDVDQEKVQPIAAKLSETYQALAQLLGEDPQGNIFVGKCMVVLFDKRVDYIRFQHELHDTDARGTGGLCHGFGNGHAHIAAFKRNNDRQTQHILIHEFTHAFMHRYQTPRPLPEWVGEGLADYIAHTIEPPPGQNLNLKSRLQLEGKQGLGDDFYDGDDLAAWQYDIAAALTGFLLERSKTAYPKFIAELKKGTPAEDALQDIYRMTPAKLTQRFKQRLDRELNNKLGG